MLQIFWYHIKILSNYICQNIMHGEVEPKYYFNKIAGRGGGKANKNKNCAWENMTSTIIELTTLISKSNDK